MKNFNKVIAILAIALLSTTMSYAGHVLIKTVPLSTPITTSGYVKIVVQLNNSFVDREVAVLLHEEETVYAWNNTMAAAGLWVGAPAPGNDPIEAMGFDGIANAWKADAVKAVDKDEQIVIWLKVDMTGATQTQGMYVQRQSETSVTELYTDIDSRGFARGGTSTNSQAKYCTIVWNDAGNNSADCFTVIEDPVVVSSVIPHTFTTDIADGRKTESVSVYPTLVENDITVASEEEVSAVKVFSLTGQQVLAVQNQEVVSLSDLSTGTYIVEVVTVAGDVTRTKIIKK